MPGPVTLNLNINTLEFDFLESSFIFEISIRASSSSMTAVDVHAFLRSSL